MSRKKHTQPFPKKKANPVTLCQMAMKAGKTVRGDGLIPAIQAGKARLVLCSKGMGANGKKKLHSKCESFRVDLIEMEDQAFDSITNKACVAFAITDDGFAKAVRKALTDIPELPDISAAKQEQEQADESQVKDYAK